MPARSAVAAGGRPHLTEAQLERLWHGRRFPEAALVTRHGVPVRVVYQGRRGRGPGPDVRGAVIAGPSGVTLRGDVELHVRASDFRAHGHAKDPAYARIILHVVFDDDTGEDTPLFGGGRAPVVALAPWVARRAGELERWLERPLLVREPCHDARRRMGDMAVGQTLELLGDGRFETAVRRAGELIERVGLEQALYAALMEALGYGGNAPQMRALASRTSWTDLAAERAGDGWRRTGVRPVNRPERRIAQAAALFGAIDAGAPSSLLRLATSPTAREALAPLLAAGIGRARALELLVNVLLPYACAAGPPPLAAAARGLYGRLPRPARYGKTRHLDTALEAASAAGVRINARRAQGLLALEKDWCAPGYCGLCPLSVGAEDG